MAAPRATQFIALRNLARPQQVRGLHMTGPATYASPVLTKERSILNLPRDIAGLRAECKRRKIEAGGSKQDLISRLNADELAHNRAFSTAALQTAARPSTAAHTNGPHVRHFNTSRALKAVNDTSTIDFAYLPEESALYGSAAPAFSQIRVPILPTATSPASHISPADAQALTHAALADASTTHALPVMKPLISTMSADTVSLAAVQPLAESADCHGLHIDFHAVAESVVATLEQSVKKPVEQQVGLVQQIFGDMVEDVLGRGKKGVVV